MDRHFKDQEEAKEVLPPKETTQANKDETRSQAQHNDLPVRG
jgi:hypothetical protein